MGTMGHWETALVWAYCNEGYSGDNGTLGDCTGMYGHTAMRDIVGTMGHWETALVWAYCNEGYSGDNGTLGDCTGMGVLQ